VHLHLLLKLVVPVDLLDSVFVRVRLELVELRVLQAGGGRQGLLLAIVIGAQLGLLAAHVQRVLRVEGPVRRELLVVGEVHSVRPVTHLVHLLLPTRRNLTQLLGVH